MRVQARSAAVAAGVVTAVFATVALAVGGLPDQVVGWFGGPSSLERHGGLVLRYRPPAGADLSRFAEAAAGQGTRVRRDGDVLHVEVPGIAEAEAGELAALLTHGGLEFREVLEDTSLATFISGTTGATGEVAPGVRLEFDTWRPEDGSTHVVPYLEADAQDVLEQAFEQLRDRGWEPPAGSHVAFEWVTGDGGALGAAYWRSYLLGEVLLDGSAIAEARRSTDPNTGRAIVLLDFTAPGGEQFHAITRRLVGKKIAHVLGGRVRSAPYLTAPIAGGRASIAMGGNDIVTQEREADVLVAVLSTVPLPPDGEVEDQIWVAPVEITARIAIWTIALGALAGAVIGLLFGLVVRVTRPSWRERIPRGARGDGRIARRIAVTLLAPVSLLVLQQIPWPGSTGVALDEIGSFGDRVGFTGFTLGDLGVRPVVDAFLLVELVSLLVPRWRRARLRPAARIAMGRYVAMLGLAFALVHGYLLVRNATRLEALGVEVLAPGLASEIAVIASLAAGTALLVIVAGMIRQHGLGNGYGALFVAEWVIHVTTQVHGTVSVGDVLGLVTLVVIGGAAVAMLRMRVGDGREAPLRIPSTGEVLETTLLAWLAAQFGLVALVVFVTPVSFSTWHKLVAFVVLVPVWSFAFARPAIVAPLAAQAGIAPPSVATWRRATLLSGAIFLLVYAAAHAAAKAHADAALIGDAVAAMLLAAVILDIVGDLRAYRAGLVVAWPMYQAQHAELVHRVLGDAGISCHLRAGHLRALLAFFGPHVPIDVMVPADSVDAARRRIAALYHEAPLQAFD